MKLNKRQLRKLADQGYTGAQIEEIENNRFRYEWTPDRDRPDDEWEKTDKEKAVEILGEDEYLSGIARATFRGSSISHRGTDYVYIEKR